MSWDEVGGQIAHFRALLRTRSFHLRMSGRLDAVNELRAANCPARL